MCCLCHVCLSVCLSVCARMSRCLLCGQYYQMLWHRSGFSAELVCKYVALIFIVCVAAALSVCW